MATALLGCAHSAKGEGPHHSQNERGGAASLASASPDGEGSTPSSAHGGVLASPDEMGTRSSSTGSMRHTGSPPGPRRRPVVASNSRSKKSFLHKPPWTKGAFKGRKKIEDRIISLTNTIRKKRGLKPLRADERLRVAARQHTQEMLQKSYYSHQSPISKWSTATKRACRAGFFGPLVAENIGMVAGMKDGAKGLVEAWKRSPGHFANMVKKNHTLTGVGVSVVKKNGTTHYYATTLFAVNRVDIRRVGLKETTLPRLTLTVTVRVGRRWKLEAFKGQTYLGELSNKGGHHILKNDFTWPLAKGGTIDIALSRKGGGRKTPFICSRIHMARDGSVRVQKDTWSPKCKVVKRVRAQSARTKKKTTLLSFQAKAHTRKLKKARWFLNHSFGGKVPLKTGRWVRLEKALPSNRKATKVSLVIEGRIHDFFIAHPGPRPHLSCP